MAQIIKQERSYNRSLVYLMPCLLQHLTVKKDYLVDSYLFNGKEDDDPKILLKYKWFTGMTEFELEMTQSPLFVDAIDLDEEHIVFVFLIPGEFIKDYYAFIEGKYSELSKKLQENIQSYWRADSSSMLYKVLKKDETLREEMSKELGCSIPKSAELSSIPNKQEETL